MKFNGKSRVEGRPKDVFAVCVDVEHIVGALRQNGLDVKRTGSPGGGNALGDGFETEWALRGKKRRVEVALEDIEAPGKIVYRTRIDGVAGLVTVDLSPVKGGNTGMQVEADLKAETMVARLLLKSARIAKASLNQRFRAGIHTLARRIEDRLGEL